MAASTDGADGSFCQVEPNRTEPSSNFFVVELERFTLEFEFDHSCCGPPQLFFAGFLIMEENKAERNQRVAWCT